MFVGVSSGSSGTSISGVIAGVTLGVVAGVTSGDASGSGAGTTGVSLSEGVGVTAVEVFSVLVCALIEKQYPELEAPASVHFCPLTE